MTQAKIRPKLKSGSHFGSLAVAYGTDVDQFRLLRLLVAGEEADWKVGWLPEASPSVHSPQGYLS
jgi:hypothetical protein